MIIDGHAHAYNRICAVTQYGVAHALNYGKIDLGADHPYRLLPPAFVNSISPREILMEYMAWAGVEKAVLLTQNIYGFNNDYLSECIQAHPDKFAAIAGIDPCNRDAASTLETLIDQKHLAGLKLDLNAQIGLMSLRPEFKLNHPGLDPVWKLLENRGRTLALDFAGPPGTPGHQLQEFRAVLEKYPTLKVVICHLGFPPCLNDAGDEAEKKWAELLDLSKSFNVWFDTAIFSFSTQLKTGPENYPYPTLKETFQKCVDRIGGSRLIFGTDIPSILLWLTYPQCVEWITDVTAKLPTPDREAILWKNADRVYFQKK
jgi:predicted TIM-barrel fold metal-dependent hydrolase